MGKDALGKISEKKEPSTSKSPQSSASPLIFIIVIIAVIGLIVYFFRDKIFKNGKIPNLKDFVKEKESQQKPEKKEETKPETLSKTESEKLQKKFAPLS